MLLYAFACNPGTVSPLPHCLVPQLTVTHALDKAGADARRMLAEDKGIDGSPVYMEFLMDIHKRVQKML